MNFQKEIPDDVAKIASELKVSRGGYSYYAFPETFASTAGPHGGVGGSAMSTFTVEAYSWPNLTIYVCDGVTRIRKGPFEKRWR